VPYTNCLQLLTTDNSRWHCCALEQTTDGIEFSSALRQAQAVDQLMWCAWSGSNSSSYQGGKGVLSTAGATALVVPQMLPSQGHRAKLVQQQLC